MFPRFSRSTLVETNPSLRRIQADTLAPLKPVWHNDVSSLPEQPWLPVANEFLDALPMHQLRGTEGAWRECLVVPDAAGTGLAWGVERSESPLAALLPAQTRENPIDGALAELSLATSAIVTRYRRPCCSSRWGGVDHRLWKRAPRRWRFVAGCAPSPASRGLGRTRGSADLSSHVDCSQIREACRAGGADFAGPVEQGRFSDRSWCRGARRRVEPRRDLGPTPRY